MWKTTTVRILETKTSETSFSIDVMIGYAKQIIDWCELINRI
jgi:hypothetical protein